MGTIDVVKLSCLVLFNHVSSGVHFSGAAPYFSGKIDPAPLQKWPVRLFIHCPGRKRDIEHTTGRLTPLVMNSNSN